jgi:hypothetical protein
VKSSGLEESHEGQNLELEELHGGIGIKNNKSIASIKQKVKHQK